MSKTKAELLIELKELKAENKKLKEQVKGSDAPVGRKVYSKAM